MSSSDLDYFLRRERQERSAAFASSCLVKDAHLELAELHAERRRALMGLKGQARQSEASRGSVPQLTVALILSTLIALFWLMSLPVFVGFILVSKARQLLPVAQYEGSRARRVVR